MTFNRNIFTLSDAAQRRMKLTKSPFHRVGQEDKLAEPGPVDGPSLGNRQDGGPFLGKDVDVPKAVDPDQWHQRLIKYFPGEALSLYLALDGILRSAVSGYELIFWLGIVTITSCVFNALYLKKVWKVNRKAQIAISTLALLVYIFSIGGVFKEFLWWKPFYGSLAVILTSAFLSFVDPPGQNATGDLSQDGT
ncbi:hypothetical protein [Azospirillum sp. SYSU D00513]|uniref:hypothetical protein n=1 Tax=Azospirillum sp. SYSU D00513 TaxID=2812561 RepID=UPI001A968E09|nr:hypothetical protein [Azospirillum sp. SYSU D00513]